MENAEKKYFWFLQNAYCLQIIGKARRNHKSNHYKTDILN